MSELLEMTVAKIVNNDLPHIQAGIDNVEGAVKALTASQSQIQTDLNELKKKVGWLEKVAYIILGATAPQVLDFVMNNAGKLGGQ